MLSAFYNVYVVHTNSINVRPSVLLLPFICLTLAQVTVLFRSVSYFLLL